MSKAAAFVGAGALALSVPALAGAAVGFPGFGANTGVGANVGATVGTPGLGLNTGVGANVGVGVNGQPGNPGWGPGYGRHPYNPYHNNAYGQGWNGGSYGQGWNGGSYGQHGNGGSYGQHGNGQQGYRSHGFGGSGRGSRG
ncbi:MAG TPA: hypothetical protein VGO39_08145 [Gaiellaceae bacterium]|nr:hypothetical protein [Gaiellaceae bacterium]